ncbi:MAG: T9SS type A sorting domain-containing protein [Bacteroidetes bacterium]|nr:T9SS type A sorting domain-containing protein [Bacteroidota bacterium]
MKKLLLFLFAMFLGATLFVKNTQAFIPVTVSGTAVTSPALAGSYTSLADALAALNSVTAFTNPGTIIFTCAGGGSETAPPTGFVIGSATLNPLLNATNNVRIITAGVVTINAGVGTATPSSAAPDGMISIAGADYITIDGLTLVDGNAANPATMEFGIGLFKASLSDGAQNNTIQNCTITVKTINNATATSPMIDGSVGILMLNATATAATTALTPVAASGANSNNKFYTNIINGGNYGMGLIGYAGATPFTTCDFNNDIGGTVLSTGNTIQNFGGGASTNPSAGIRTLAQYSINISFNTVNNNTGANTNHATTFRGIYLNTATSANATINNNMVTLRSGGTTTACTAIDNQSGSTAASNTISISDNTVSGAYATATTGVWTGIQNGGTAAIVNIDGNYMTSFVLAGTGTHVMIETGSPTTASANRNSITNITRSGLSGSWRIIKMTSPTNITVNSNTIDGLSWTALTSTGSISPVYGISSAVNVTINDNIIRNLSIPLTGTIIGILENGISGLKTIQNNQVFNFFTTAGGAGGASFTGISELQGSTNDISGNQIYALNSTGTTGGTGGSIIGITVTSGVTNNVHKNRICNLSSTSTNPLVTGIAIGGGTTNNLYNNMIGDLRATAANAANPVIGMNITGGTTDNLYYNTVNLLTESTGALFGSSAVSVSTSSAVTLRNNIFHNTSGVKGAGLTVAYRRSSTALTSYGATSNNNLFYAGIPTASNLIFYDGTNSDQTLSAYKTRVASRDAASVTEDLTSKFISTVCGDTYFLHIDASVATQVESGGAILATTSTDFDGNYRYGDASYSGTGTAPDIGADEFNGIPIDLQAPSVASISLVGNACNLSSRNVTAVISDASGVAGAPYLPRIYFRKNAGAYFSTAGALTSGNSNAGTWTFIIDYSLLGGVVSPNVIDYFIVAQDVPGNVGGNPSAGLVLTNVNTITTPPTTPLTYTVQNSIGGIYNVGSAQTYTTLTAAVNAYNSSCLTGPVTFLLTDASYTEAAAMTINANAGASAVNTLTIKPTLANTTIAVTGGSTAAVLIINGADYVIIDGSIGNTVNVCCSTPASRDLTITNTNAGTSSAVIWFQTNGTDGATNNTVKNCNLAGNSNTTTLFGVGSGSSSISITSLGTGNNSNSYVNNNISKTQYGIYSQGASAAIKNTGTLILMNLINTASPNNVARGGIWTGFEDNITISCNIIDGINQTASPDVFGITCGFGTAIAATTSAGNEVTNATIIKNVIGNVINSGTFSSYGIGVCAAASGTTLIANNMIYGVAANATSPDISGGIVLGGGAGSTTHVYYNTVSMQGTITGTSSATQTSACLVVTNSVAPVLDLRDNILTNTQHGNSGATLTFAAIALGYNTYTTLTSDYNDLYSAGAGPGTYATGITGTVVLGTNSVTLSNWQTATGKDAHSAAILPVFVLPADLHLIPASNTTLNDLGTPVSVGDDIDCTPRHAATPDMGADEFSPPNCVTAIGGTASGSATLCASGTPAITATGYSSGSGSTYQWIHSTTPGDYPNSGSLVSGQTNPATLSTGVVSTTTYYWLRVTCGTNVSSDNSTMVTITINPAPAAVTVTGAGTFCTSTTITAANGSDGIIYFQGTTSGGTSSAIPSVSEVITASGTYYFRAKSALGCWGTEGSAVVTIQTPLGTMTGTDAHVCLNGTGAMEAVSSSGCTGYVNSGTTLNGAFNAATDRIALRPTTSIVNTSTCSFDAAITRNYDSINFQVSTTGSYTFEMNDNTAYDGMGYIVTTGFFPGNCLGGGTWIIGDDDSGSGNEPVMTATLTAGVNYKLISTTYSTTSGTYTGSYSWAITPPAGGQIMLPGSGTLEWYAAAIGGSAIGTGSPFNPVGVAGSGLINTSVAGTTTYYAACSSTSACRTPVNFVIHAQPTPTITPSAPVVIAGNVQMLTVSVPGDPTATFTWSPFTYLYATADTLVHYTGQILSTVYTKPRATTTYIATATTSIGCTDSHPVTVTLNACEVPSGVSSSAVTATTATISWTAPSVPPASGYQYEVRTSNGPGTGSAGLTASGTTAAGVLSAGISGLHYHVTYHVYVRSDCGSGSYSDWTPDYSFYTPLPGNINVTGIVSGTLDTCYNATSTITVAGTPTTFEVQTGGRATFIAGVKISFLPGTTVQHGGYLRGSISTGTYCGGAPPPVVSKMTGEDEPQINFIHTNFTIYPNPTNGNFTLVQKGDRVYGTVKVEVYSMSGERVMTDQMIGEQKHEFRFTDVPVGLYFVRVVADDYVETIKLIRTR